MLVFGEPCSVKNIITIKFRYIFNLLVVVMLSFIKFIALTSTETKPRIISFHFDFFSFEIRVNALSMNNSMILLHYNFFNRVLLELVEVKILVLPNQSNSFVFYKFTPFFLICLTIFCAFNFITRNNRSSEIISLLTCPLSSHEELIKLRRTLKNIKTQRFVPVLWYFKTFRPAQFSFYDLAFLRENTVFKLWIVLEKNYSEVFIVVCVELKISSTQRSSHFKLFPVKYMESRV